jgi:hypothetical protein
VNPVRVVAFLIAIGMSIAFGYSLGESAGRKASTAGDGVSQYQFDQMARQFSRTVYEPRASTAGDDPAPDAWRERQSPVRPPPRATSRGLDAGENE